MFKKKILLITERRADYSRFKPILNLIKKNKKFEYFLVVTGLHLLKSHGSTINEIINYKFKIYKKIKNFNHFSSDDGEAMVNGIGEVLKKISPIIKNVKPDIILTGFDIGANFALTVAGAHFNIPVAHIQGGEVTGSIDESLRHAMSKFANFHFVANNDAKKRLVKMGENKKNIFIVGCPSIDALKIEKEIDERSFMKKFNLNPKEKFMIAIQHPVTTEQKSSKWQILQTIKAIKRSKIPTIFVMPNNDTGHKSIIREIKKTSIIWTKNLSLSEYKFLLNRASILIGNSSSGIHEAASFKLPVVNIGSRQHGRLRPFNVVDVDYNSNKILKSIRFCLNNNYFRKKIKKLKNPYGDGNSAKYIINIIEKLNLNLSTQKINTY